jgi:DeoR family transcriptional regulator of aga operon
VEDPIPAEVRRDRIASLVAEREFVRVQELSELFDISEVTIRTDLGLLAERGLVERVHGGAMAADREPKVERTFEEALGEHAAEKAAIGRRAAQMVRNGGTVILDVGTTTTAIARALVTREDLTDATVFTTGLTNALELEAAIPRLSVVVTGGTLRPKQHSLVEPMAHHLLDQVHASVAFIGCNGVHPERGITNVNLPEATVKRRMVEAATKTVVVADGSKLGHISVAKIADLSQVDLLITGPSASPEVVAELVGRGLAVDVVEPDPYTEASAPAPAPTGGNT